VVELFGPVGTAGWRDAADVVVECPGDDGAELVVDVCEVGDADWGG
jgi:hypothetical protein